LLGVEVGKATVAEVEAKIGSADANRISAEAKRDKARTDITLAEAQQKAAEADERRLAALLKYTKLPAPFAGVVTWRNVDRSTSPRSRSSWRRGKFGLFHADPLRPSDSTFSPVRVRPWQ